MCHNIWPYSASTFNKLSGLFHPHTSSLGAAAVIFRVHSVFLVLIVGCVPLAGCCLSSVACPTPVATSAQPLDELSSSTAETRAESKTADRATSRRPAALKEAGTADIESRQVDIDETPERRRAAERADSERLNQILRICDGCMGHDPGTQPISGAPQARAEYQ